MFGAKICKQPTVENRKRSCRIFSSESFGSEIEKIFKAFHLHTTYSFPIPPNFNVKVTSIPIPVKHYKYSCTTHKYTASLLFCYWVGQLLPMDAVYNDGKRPNTKYWPFVPRNWHLVNFCSTFFRFF